MLFGNYYALFKLVRDYIVFWRFFVVDGNKEQRSKDWLYSTYLFSYLYYADDEGLVENAADVSLVVSFRQTQWKYRLSLQ